MSMAMRANMIGPIRPASASAFATLPHAKVDPARAEFSHEGWDRTEDNFP